MSMRTKKTLTSNGGELEPAIIETSKMGILLDNGHGSDVKGKKSPKFEDGRQLFEYEFNRDIVKRISEQLKKLNINYKIVVPELNDIPLTTRANRVNRYCSKFGKNNCLLISIHANASGMGDKGMTARGGSVGTTKGKTKSDEYADIFYKEAEKLLPLNEMTLIKDKSDGDSDYEKNFTILYKSGCPAILTENLFQDNKTDCEFLMSDKGRDIITQIHINAIKKIVYGNKENK